MTARSFVLAAAAAATVSMTGTPALAADTPLSQQLHEARMEGQIIGAYTINRHLNPFKLDVDIEGNTAVLSGVVESDVAKDLAEQIALGVDGIDEVDNRIALDDKALPDDDGERDFGDVVSDATITASIKSKLLWNSNTQGLDIQVETRDGKVLLAGTADSAASRELAGRLAANTDGVRAVENRLRPRSKSDTSDDLEHAVERAGATVSDAWITSKVKSSFLFSRNIAGNDIAVDTRDGVVTLSGDVMSGAERELAVEMAEGIRGVKSVEASALRAANS